MGIDENVRLNLPLMRYVQQSADIPPAIDVIADIDQEWVKIKARLPIKEGARVAIGVGSRGIANLDVTVKEVVRHLKEAGLKPFITPAMGSHGGATAEGQADVLRVRGITEESVGAPVQATMEVVSMGEVDGIPLFLDRLAREADGIVLINRIKPHTNFIGPTESGIIKMMAIGLGNQVGAEHYHRLSVVRSQYEIISKAGKALIQKTPFLFGVGLFENQRHETAAVKIALQSDVEAMETELMTRARECLPTLPLDEIDLLIIDEMGKEISGEGIDPNVVGRDVILYGAKRPLPKITRIFVRDLTDASEGSAVGIAQADFTTQRLVDKIDFHATAINCLTACAPEAGKIPLAYPNDRDAIKASLMTLRPVDTKDMRIVHIKNTMSLMRMLVTSACLPDLEDKPGVVVESEELDWEFDSEGNLTVRDIG